MKLSNMRMFAELGCTYVEEIENFAEIINLTDNNLLYSSIDKDEFQLKPRDANVLKDWEIRLFRKKRFTFAMDSCTHYDHFVEVLEIILHKINTFLTPSEIVTMGVQGHYLYSLNSLQEFSQLVFAWSGSYLYEEETAVEINDLGVKVFFEKDSLKVNIICKLAPGEEISQYFPGADLSKMPDLNLFIDISVATNEPAKIKKALTASLAQTIKTHVYHATKLIEERLAGQNAGDN